MDVPEVEVNIAGHEVTLTEWNTWVCIFHEATYYDHLYCYGDNTFVVFECKGLLDKLIKLGFPMQVRRLPTPWDESAYDEYIASRVEELDHELEDLEGS